MKISCICATLIILLFALPVCAAHDEVDSCIEKLLMAGADELTLGEVRAECEGHRDTLPVTGALIDQRIISDKLQSDKLLSLIPHKPNYILGGYYFAKPQTNPFEQQFPARNIEIDAVELKFQFSLKTMLYDNLLGQTGDIWVGYTNRSFWQAFNTGNSAPFRETNHEPEVWLQFGADHNLGGVKFRGGSLGMAHQSNGQFDALSRSWNKLYFQLVFQKRDVYFAVKPWWRIPESADNDDNPDIEDYLGNFEFYAIKEWGSQTLGLMFRNNLRFDEKNHGAVQLDYTFPMFKQLRGYVQWFYGYGESLIDYNHEANTLGFGIMLANWL